MSDQPELHEKLQFSPRLAGWGVAAGAIAAIAAAILAAAAPPSPYSNLLAATAVCGVVVGVGIFLAGLVLLVSKSFGDRYGHTEQAITEYQGKTTARLNGLAQRQQLILDNICELNGRLQTICDAQQVLHNKVDRCMGEVSVLTDGLGELTEAFVEEGLPEQREN